MARSSYGNAVLDAFTEKIRQTTADKAHHEFQSKNTMQRMAYERQMIHMARANAPLHWDGEAPHVALHKHNLATARQAHHNHNKHIKESDEKTNEYVREMVEQSYH